MLTCPRGYRSALLALLALLVAVGDPAAGQVVCGYLDLHSITRQNPNVVLAHLAAEVTEHSVPVVELDTEVSTFEGFDRLALEQDGVVFHFWQRVVLCWPASATAVLLQRVRPIWATIVASSSLSAHRISGDGDILGPVAWTDVTTLCSSGPVHAIDAWICVLDQNLFNNT